MGRDTTAEGYPTDLTDAEWAIMEPLLPAPKPGGRPRTTCLRRILKAIFHVLRSGCQWRMVPKEFPPYQTVYEYFRTWRLTGVWERLHDTLRGDVRETAGRHRQPSAGIIDSQAVGDCALFLLAEDLPKMGVLAQTVRNLQ